MTLHTHGQGWKGDAVTAPGVDTADDDFVESSQAEGCPVRSNANRALQGIVAGTTLMCSGIPAPDEF
jgi:hypothetical protein